MTHWLILKSDPLKEFAVARALEALGHHVWVPTYVHAVKERVTVGPGITLQVKRPKERPLLPSVVLAAHTPPPRYLAAVDNLKGIWRDCLDLPILVPELQVTSFRERVEAANAAESARIVNAQPGKRKAKRMKLDPTLAEELKAMLFSNQEREAA